MNAKELNIATLYLHRPWKISLTWIVVLIENILMAIVPLFIGYSIDGLLQDDFTNLWYLVSLFFALIVISVLRRIYDTRVYSQLRIDLGLQVDTRHQHQSVSIRNARLDMSAELIEFLEESLPQIITSAVQIIIALVILYTFHMSLAVAALIATLTMMIIYSFFHGGFYRLNQQLNLQTEKQVSVLTGNGKLLDHLNYLRQAEIKLSDREAYLYGLIFICLLSFLVFNLWKSTSLDGVTAGMLFSIVTYSWEYIEAILIMPITLQQWSRLSEIQKRINSEAFS